MTKLEDLPLRATATIDQGTITGRVRVHGVRGGKSRGTRVPRRPPSAAGRKTLTFSAAAGERADLALAAELVNMSRSEFIRRALVAQYGKLFAPGWRDVKRRR